MKLSIITVNLNNRLGLERTINSVISQSFSDYEWIVIDGGSTDGSRELIELNANLFSYWVSERDHGVYNAMNKGIKVAKGEYIQFLNSGDCLYDNSVLERVFSSGIKADIIFSNKTILSFNDGTSSLFVRKYGNHFTPFNLIHQTINHQSAFIKKHLFELVGDYDESYHIVADRKFFFDAILIHSASTAMLDYVIVRYDADGFSSHIDSSEEKDQLICDYLPKQSVDDYHDYVAFSNYINDNQHAISVYTKLSNHWLSRKLMHFLYLLVK